MTDNVPRSFSFGPITILRLEEHKKLRKEHEDLRRDQVFCAILMHCAYYSKDIREIIQRLEEQIEDPSWITPDSWASHLPVLRELFPVPESKAPLN